ncbi:MAG: hypothetical protein L0Y60_02700, partial [Beijerinckiaceae bacterium]|nr:hypothetical protein [Beijerinckiaceae bacterium]
MKRVAKATLPKWAIEAGSNARFLAERYFSKNYGVEVGDVPLFDEESTKYFAEQLNKCRTYLEYGTGGSTVQAARMGKQFCAVESDAIFLDAVRNKIGKLQNNQHLIAIDIGITGSFGVPIFTKPTKSRLTSWRKYPNAPWALFDREKHPDLMLVDGRFRVACAL